MEQKPVETCGYVRSRNFLKAWFGLGDGLGLYSQDYYFK